MLDVVIVIIAACARHARALCALGAATRSAQRTRGAFEMLREACRDKQSAPWITH